MDLSEASDDSSRVPVSSRNGDFCAGIMLRSGRILFEVTEAFMVKQFEVLKKI